MELTYNIKERGYNPEGQTVLEILKIYATGEDPRIDMFDNSNPFADAFVKNLHTIQTFLAVTNDKTTIVTKMLENMSDQEIILLAVSSIVSNLSE